MIRGLVALALGAAGALKADKALDRVRQRFRPSGLTGAFLDHLNDRLEKGGAHADRSSPDDGPR